MRFQGEDLPSLLDQGAPETFRDFMMQIPKVGDVKHNNEVHGDLPEFDKNFQNHITEELLLASESMDDMLALINLSFKVFVNLKKLKIKRTNYHRSESDEWTLDLFKDSIVPKTLAVLAICERVWFDEVFIESLIGRLSS